jgi:hypothetical protein
MKAVRILSFSLLLLLQGCGGDYKDPVSAEGSGQEAVLFGSQKVRVLSGTPSVSGGSIRGSGALLFDSRYREARSGGSYALDFTLEEGGMVKLVSHANESLAGGFELEFRRSGTGADSLKVALHAQGATWRSVSNFTNLPADQAVRLQIDLHNDEAPAHILVWNRALGDDFDLTKAVLNSAHEIDGSPGIGSGTRWGLVLDKATVTLAEKGETKFEH